MKIGDSQSYWTNCNLHDKTFDISLCNSLKTSHAFTEFAGDIVASYGLID